MAASDVIVVGEVLDFRSEEKERRKGVVDTVFAVRIKVRAVEKSSDKTASLPTGTVITIHGSNLARAPREWVGPSGNHTVDYRRSLRTVLELTRANHVEGRFYLTARDGKYSLLTPNGLEVISLRKRK